MKNFNVKNGFTVLEFLIVTAIMVILLSIVLSGLNTSRIRSNDERKISDLNTVVLGLTHYFQICGEYPIELSSIATCDNVNNPDLLGKLLPELTDVNTTYYYAPLSYNTMNGSGCLGAHIGIALSQLNNAATVRDSNFNSDDPLVTICRSTYQGDTATAVPMPFNGASSGVYDKKL